MIKALKVAVAAFAVPAMIASTPVMAASPGQLAGGDNYVVKNVTKAGAYANNVSATCNEEVQFSMQLSNTGFGALNDVTLKATLPASDGTSTATATTDLGGTTGTSDSASVTLGTNQTLGYEAGSTALYDGNGALIRTLGDSVVGSGVNLGTIEGSTTKFVNFKAKVTCPQPPTDVCPNIPGDQKEIPAGQVKDAQGNCVTPPKTPENPKTAPVHTPATLPSTGAAEVLSGMTGASALGYGVQRYIASRRNRQ